MVRRIESGLLIPGVVITAYKMSIFLALELGRLNNRGYELQRAHCPAIDPA
jgi:hypothetical protein